MSQSALTVGLLALAFLLFVAARGNLTSYTNALWGQKTGGGSGSGAKPPKIVNPLDRKGDGFDLGDAAHIAGMVIPFPFNIPLDVIEL